MKHKSYLYLLTAAPREPHRLQAQAAQPLHQARAGAEGAERARQPQAIHSTVMMMIVKIRDGLIPRVWESESFHLLFIEMLLLVFL